MTPTKEHLEIGSSSAESENSQVKGRPRPESAHLRADAVSLEIPIKVHGSLVPNATAGAAPQAQPFEEQTTTMIVFPQGGVLKMSTTVSAGQVMVLTNLKSRQDAICRVIRVRAYGKTQSYVEVEFTSPQPGYWGVYFPTDGPEVARMAPAQPTTDSPAVTAPVPAVTVASNAIPLPAAQEPAAAPPASPARPTTASLAESPAGLNAASLIASTEEQVPDVSWTPAPALASPGAKAPEPPIQAEALQASSALPRTKAPSMLPESSFASIGTKEDVEYVATGTKGTRQNPFAESAKRPASADADISAAIDALIAPAASAASTPTASASSTAAPANRAATGERVRETSTVNANAPVAAHVMPSVSHAAESASEAALPVPKQMFGVMLDSANPATEKTSKSSGSKMWIPIGIAALLAVAGGGAYYYHMRTSANPAGVALASSAAAMPAAHSAVSQAPITQSADANAAAATQMPDQSAAVQPPDAALRANTARDLIERSAARAEDYSAKPRSSEALSNRRSASPALSESKPVASAQPQPNVAIPSTFGVLNARPVVRTATVDSAGAAPVLDASGSPTIPAGSVPSIAALAPNVPAPPKPASSAPVRVGGKIQPPRLVSSVLPVYPAIAQQANVTGTVVIETTINKDGNVSKMKVVSGPELLRGAALSALHQWKYEPSKLNGEPISVQMVVSIQFH
ncbi:MAG: TonB family protein [Candidatus Acidiferrales bacterium]